MIITSRQVHSIQLQSLSFEDVTEKGAAFLHAKHLLGASSNHHEAFSRFRQTMKWLWHTVVEPILDSIDFTTYKAGPDHKPRVIWIFAGLTHLLPLHAAVIFEPDEGHTDTSSTHDRVVSSYAQSIQSLLHKRTRQADLSSRTFTNVAVASIFAMDNTQDLAPLSASEEAADVTSALSNAMKANTCKQPTLTGVKAALEATGIAHFACHAIANAIDPSLSSVKLENSELTVRDLIRMKLDCTQLVYLSACESGANKDTLLRDEGIHVAGGFHMSGVPHVISTLWEVDDYVARVLAGMFYRRCKWFDAGGLDLSSVPEALHGAVGELKATGTEPMLWAAYIHSGP